MIQVMENFEKIVETIQYIEKAKELSNQKFLAFDQAKENVDSSIYQNNLSNQQLVHVVPQIQLYQEKESSKSLSNPNCQSRFNHKNIKKYNTEQISEAAKAQKLKVLRKINFAPSLSECENAIRYEVHIKENHSTFVQNCHAMSQEFTKITKEINIFQRMKQCKNFSKYQNSYTMDGVLLDAQKTLVIDVINTFVVQVPYQDFEDDTEFIKINMKKFAQTQCICFEPCNCDILVYQIRPNVFQFLKTVQPFFELICFSNSHPYLLNEIIEHLERIMNKPIIKFQNQPQNSKQRIKNSYSNTVYFSYIMHKKHYLKIDEYSFENLYILLKNRSKENMIFISSNPLNIIGSLRQNFLTLPLIEYQVAITDTDIELILLENYLIQVRNLNLKAIVRTDFGYLLEPKKLNPQKSSSKKSQFIHLIPSDDDSDYDSGEEAKKQNCVVSSVIVEEKNSE